MSAGRWMLHLDLTCGSVEYAGDEPPADALARILAVLRAQGLLQPPPPDPKQLKPETQHP